MCVFSLRNGCNNDGAKGPPRRCTTRRPAHPDLGVVSLAVSARSEPPTSHVVPPVRLPKMTEEAQSRLRPIPTNSRGSFPLRRIQDICRAREGIGCCACGTNSKETIVVFFSFESLVGEPPLPRAPIWIAPWAPVSHPKLCGPERNARSGL